MFNLKTFSLSNSAVESDNVNWQCASTIKFGFLARSAINFDKIACKLTWNRSDFTLTQKHFDRSNIVKHQLFGANIKYKVLKIGSN